MENQLLNCQRAAGLRLKLAVSILGVSQDNFAYALAESLGKSNSSDTVKGYYRKVPQKFLISSYGYKEFRRGLEESVDKLSTKGFVPDVDAESVRNSWAQRGEEILDQFDKIHEKAADTYVKATVESNRKKIEDLLSD